MTTEPQDPNDAAPTRGKLTAARSIFLFLLAFVASIFVGKGFEILTSETTFANILQVQSQWRSSLEAMAPFSLATNYMDDISHIMDGGDWTWAPPNYQRVTSSPFDAAPLTGLAEPQHQEEVDGVWRIAPVGALYRTWTRLTYSGGWSYFWAILQLGVGLLGFMVAFSSLEGTTSSPRYFPEGIWGWLFGVPLGVVAAASVLAWCFKYVMLGGVIAFGWFADLAGACCTATGIGGFCWFCFHKFAEYSVAEAIETKLK